MQIEFECKNCHHFLSEDMSMKGHTVACTQCGSKLQIPLQGSIEIGNIISDHKILSEIGQGAMGKVYLANHLLMNRQVAIKTISPKIRQDEDAVDSFIKELQLGAHLNHPNIVTVYTAGYTDGVYFISMQFIDGYDMNTRVDSQGNLNEKEALGIIIKIADALSYAWNELRLIHRDIKPENIRISSRGEVMILDFGLAQMRSNDNVQADDGLIIGTPDFMSPEQGEGRTDIDFRADMYSLGIVLIYLLTGKRPFSSDDALSVVNMHINKPLPKLSDLNPEVKVSAECATLINKMTQKNRDERYTCWEEVEEVANRILNPDNDVKSAAKKKTGSTIKTSASSSRDLRAPRHSAKRRRSKSDNTAIVVIVLVIILAMILYAVFVTKIS